MLKRRKQRKGTNKDVLFGADTSNWFADMLKILISTIEFTILFLLLQ